MHNIPVSMQTCTWRPTQLPDNIILCKFLFKRKLLPLSLPSSFLTPGWMHLHSFSPFLPPLFPSPFPLLPLILKLFTRALLHGMSDYPPCPLAGAHQGLSPAILLLWCCAQHRPPGAFSFLLAVWNMLGSLEPSLLTLSNTDIIGEPPPPPWTSPHLVSQNFCPSGSWFLFDKTLKQPVPVSSLRSQHP